MSGGTLEERARKFVRRVQKRTPWVWPTKQDETMYLKELAEFGGELLENAAKIAEEVGFSGHDEVVSEESEIVGKIAAAIRAYAEQGKKGTR